MAKAKTFTRKITRKVIDEVPGYVELNLTPEEAEALMFILDRVVGAPEGVCGHVDNIRKALGGGTWLWHRSR
jgi:hypothetical protein